ncbi:hypothetical protein Htur_5027 (plasmid) [Haloterrigena turkmenica DSM 5511]|uniref:Uncharacterized protein n=1 Tax=Haloterrigena turkmenica (strain ATCC 51198 / DSM 5511 / JCM 9101 / NCIMB 13204 / VKM B-1734 / 4k) TaxID=543526 RepID=D2S3G8_HALTV|nr:hypothetical protein Htur_5027 [Haloterrigena turkmenica DSM 5511]
MPWKRDDEYNDKPYGDPRRAANIRWESRPKRTLRRTREGAGSLLGLVVWPLRALGRSLSRLTRGR